LASDKFSASRSTAICHVRKRCHQRIPGPGAIEEGKTKTCAI